MNSDFSAKCLPAKLGSAARKLFKWARADSTATQGAAASGTEISCDMPQADMREERLQAFEQKDWRSHFAEQLSGRGIEIGPLHRPMVRHERMEIDYIDRFTVEELRRHYPELKDLPFVEPNIIGDAQTFDNIGDAIYDFVISAHVIEHMRNPVEALRQWCRVLKPGGLLYLIVPDKRQIFDRRRVRTTLEHLILDFKRPSIDRDFEHYLDYARFVHDRCEAEAITEADRLLEEDYSIHYHVFLPSDVIRLLEWFSANVLAIAVLEGPVMAPGSDEFHLLVRKTAF